MTTTSETNSIHSASLETNSSSADTVDFAEELQPYLKQLTELENQVAFAEKLQHSRPLRMITIAVRRIMRQDAGNLDDVKFSAAYTYFKYAAQFDQLGFRLTGKLQPAELKLQGEAKARFDALRQRIERLVPLDEVEASQIQPTLFHATIAHYWNESLRDEQSEQKKVTVMGELPESGKSWTNSTPVDEKLFRLSLLGVSDYDQPLTPQEVADILLKYNEFIRTDERVVQAIGEAYHDINALLDGNGQPALQFEPNRVILLTWERYLQIVQSENRGGSYVPSLDTLLIPIRRKKELTTASAEDVYQAFMDELFSGLFSTDNAVDTKAELYEVLVHELIHMARARYVLQPLEIALEEGLTVVIGQALQERRNYLTGRSNDVYPLETAVMRNLIGSQPRLEATLLWDESILRKIIESKYADVASHYPDMYAAIFADIKKVYELGAQISWGDPNAETQLREHCFAMLLKWGVDPDNYMEKMINNFKYAR